MLKILEHLDSPEMAESRRRELDIAGVSAKELGRSAIDAAANGYYFDSSGRSVDWAERVNNARRAKVSIPPDTSLPTPEPMVFAETRVQVANETTLGASRRLVEAGLKPLALNFANGFVPGGGFLNGARSQEEALCRSSVLYETLVGDPMYAAHRQRERKDSSDWAIYSPDVPVFRSDDGVNLDEPWSLSFITCAAPIVPDIPRWEAGNLLERRIHRVLAIARAHGYASLVLGAWGCGAFGNDPHRTARDFRKALETEFCESFSDVIFAISDWSPERRFLGPFRDVFSQQ